MRSMTNASNEVLSRAADVPVGGGRLRVLVAAVSTAGLRGGGRREGEEDSV